VLLVVEDDADIRDAVVDLLAEAGHSVRFARSLAEARAVLANASPAALVLDLHLPDGSSAELLAELAAAGVRVPSVVMTAAIDGEDVAAQYGAEYLRKPFAIEELLDIAERLVRELAASETA
jgi:DNA-binding NtrC family response regulator